MDFDELLGGVKKIVDGHAAADTEETDMHRLYKLVKAKRAKAAESFISKANLSLDQRDLAGNTLLHAVILNEESSETIKIVVNLGFDINARGKSDWTPLYLVRKYLRPTATNKELHAWLVEQGAIAHPDLLGEAWS